MINLVQSILSTCIEFDTADKATIISGALPAIATICGFIITVIAWKNNVKTRRADYINDLLDKLHNDKLIKNTIYLLQYNNKWYDQKFYKNHKLELQIDTTLSYLSYICYLHAKRIISKKEFRLFQSMINHAASNESTVRYFYNLRHYSEVYSYKLTAEANPTSKRKHNNFTKSFTFKYLFDYIIKHKFIDMNKFSKADLSDEVYYRVLKLNSKSDVSRRPNLTAE